MPTFENGWICRECWTANREFDGRCYRCHADRPADASTMTLPLRTEQTAGSAVAEAAGVVQAPVEPAPKRVTGLLGGVATPAKPQGHCLRCGHRLRDRANYCTGCGTQVSGAAPQVQAAQPPSRPTVPAVPTHDAIAARVDAVRNVLGRPATWLWERLASIRDEVAARRAAFGGLGKRVALARPSLPVIAGVLLLGSFTLFALTARLLVGLTSGQLVFLVAGAAILSGFASTMAVLASAGRRSSVASAEERLRTLDELLDAGRILEAEHATHRAALLQALSGFDESPSVKPARTPAARSAKSSASARPSPTPAR